MRLRPLVVLIAAVLVLAGCTGSDGGSGGGSASAAETGAAASRPFTVELPDGYRAEESKVSGAVVAFYVGPTVDDFRVNVNVTRESAGGRTLRRFQTLAVTGLKQTLKISALTSPSDTTVDGERALRYTFEDTQEGVELKQSQVVVLHRGYGYVLTFTAPRDRFDEQQDAATKLVDSLRWT